MKRCALCGLDAPLAEFLNPQSGNERDHCRSCWKQKTRDAAAARRDAARAKRAQRQAPQPPEIPPCCPRCGSKFAYTDTDGDYVCKDCNELLVCWSNYRRALVDYQRLQATRIRGLGRPKKGEVLVHARPSGRPLVPVRSVHVLRHARGRLVGPPRRASDHVRLHLPPLHPRRAAHPPRL